MLGQQARACGGFGQKSTQVDGKKTTNGEQKPSNYSWCHTGSRKWGRSMASAAGVYASEHELGELPAPDLQH